MVYKGVDLDYCISIHALREEGDDETAEKQLNIAIFLSTPSARRATKFDPSNKLEENFYPRPPRGGRQTLASLEEADKRFLSTPSARRATCARRQQHTP